MELGGLWSDLTGRLSGVLIERQGTGGPGKRAVLQASASGNVVIMSNREPENGPE